MFCLSSDDIPVQADDGSQQMKLATIDEDGDTGGKHKALRTKPIKKEKGDKSRVKEMKNTEVVLKSGGINGDSVDSVQTVIARGQQRTSVDNVEMQSYSKNMSHTLNSTRDESLTSSSFSGKHSSPLVKTSGMKNSISNKDIKNTKAAGHVRHASGGSVGSESLSTDL